MALVIICDRCESYYTAGMKSLILGETENGYELSDRPKAYMKRVDLCGPCMKQFEGFLDGSLTIDSEDCDETETKTPDSEVIKSFVPGGNS